MSTAQIKGPLGELSMEIPPYINIDQDPKLSGPTLTIQDPRDAKQKAMWGMLLNSALCLQIANRGQVLPAHTSKTTFLASVKATALSFASSVSVSVPRWKIPRRLSNQNFLARSS